MHRFITFFTISLFAFISLFFYPKYAAANVTNHGLNEPNKAAIIHIVKRGETLYRIALTYGVNSQAIMAANGMRSTKIILGQALMIPGKTSPSAPIRPATPKIPPKTSILAPPSPPNATSKVSSPVDQIYMPVILDHNERVAALGATNVPPVGKYVWVSISQQRMMMYENGKLVHENLVSTGRAGSETATGNFRIKTKLERPYSRLWNLWMPNWLGIYDVGPYENGFHAHPSTPSGTVVWKESLGKPASFGCIVLSDSDSALLYAWADIGTPVAIRP